MSRGSADEAVVAVKPVADEVMVTWLRAKLPESDKEVGGEGRSMGSSSSEPEYRMFGGRPRDRAALGDDVDGCRRGC